VGALLFQFERDRAQALDGDDSAFVTLGDVVVLAEDTGEVAAREEDRARAMAAADDRFFPKMQGSKGDLRLRRGAAEAGLQCTVDRAVVGTKVTFHAQVIIPAMREEGKSPGMSNIKCRLFVTTSARESPYRTAGGRGKI